MAKVLLVEEEKALRDELSGWLKEENISLVTAEDQQKAREIIEQEEFDLVIVDLPYHLEEQLPLLEELRENPRLEVVPFFFLKSSEQANNLIEELGLRFDDFMNKPLDKAEFLLRLKTRLKKAWEMIRLQSELRQFEALFEIGQVAHKSLKPEEVGPQLLPLCLRFFSAESAAIFIQEEREGLILLSSYGEINRRDLDSIRENISQYVFNSQNPLFLKNPLKDPRFLALKLKEPQNFKTVVSIPLKAGTELIGVLDFYNAPVFVLRDSSLKNFINSAASEVARVLNLSRKFSRVHQSLQGAMEELSILYEISDALGSTLNLDELLRLVVRNALRSFDAQVVSLMMLDQAKSELVIRFAEGLSQEVVKNTRVKLGDGIAGKVAKSGQPLLLVDVVGFGTAEVEKDIKSALSVPMKIREEVIGVLNVSKTSRYKFTENDLKLCFNLAGLAAQAIEKAALYQDIRNSLQEIKDSYLSTIKALAGAIEAKDPYTQGHVERVAKYGLAIAMELDPDLLKDDVFRYALILHDVGKIGVPDSILSKPGPLTDEEMQIIRLHPDAGAKIIAPIKFLKKAVDLVRYHQERYDGAGYPQGLKAEEIPLVARIISVADAFDAITSDRPYRKGKEAKFAREEIVKNSGKQFDPKVVKAFLSALEKKLFP